MKFHNPYYINFEGHDLAGQTLIKVITVDNDVIDDLIILIVKANDQRFTAQRIAAYGGSEKKNMDKVKVATRRICITNFGQTR